MPADSGEIDQIDFAPPWMSGRPAEPNTRIGPIQSLLRNGAPPPIEIVHVQPNHEVLRERLVVETLEDEFGAAVPKSRVAIVLSDLLETEVHEQSAAGLVIFAARHEGK